MPEATGVCCRSACTAAAVVVGSCLLSQLLLLCLLTTAPKTFQDTKGKDSRYTTSMVTHRPRRGPNSHWYETATSNRKAARSRASQEHRSAVRVRHSGQAARTGQPTCTNHNAAMELQNKTVSFFKSGNRMVDTTPAAPWAFGTRVTVSLGSGTWTDLRCILSGRWLVPAAHGIYQDFDLEERKHKIPRWKR